MTGPQHKAMGVALAAVAGPLVGLPMAGVAAAGMLALCWPRRGSLQVVAVMLFVLVAQRVGASPVALALFLVVTIISALVPDFDHPHSTISKVFPPGYYLFRWTLSNPLTWLVAGKARMASLVRHRALSHTVWALALWIVGLGWGVDALAALGGRRGGRRIVMGLADTLPHWTRAWGDAPVQLGVFCAAAGGLGFLSHIMADSMTKSRTQPLAPFSSWKCQLLPDRWLLTTGGASKGRPLPYAAARV